MSLSLAEKSTYYRGLLVLARRDRIIHARERELMLQIGRMLDFDARFCEAAIDEVIHNKHISDDPVIFLKPETAECFLKDGLRLALVDGELHPRELDWLRLVAKANHVCDTCLDVESSRTAGIKETFGRSSKLEIQKYL